MFVRNSALAAFVMLAALFLFSATPTRADTCSGNHWTVHVAYDFTGTVLPNRATIFSEIDSTGALIANLDAANTNSNGDVTYTIPHCGYYAVWASAKGLGAGVYRGTRAEIIFNYSYDITGWPLDWIPDGPPR